MILLQSVNRWLRYTGFRLVVCYHEPQSEGPMGFKLTWFGWRNFGGWDCRPWRWNGSGWGLRP